MAYGRRIYSTPSNAIPGSIIVQPDESIVQNFVNLGLDRKDAECVAISLRIKKPLITSSKKVAEIATRNGCVTLLVGGG